MQKNRWPINNSIDTTKLEGMDRESPENNCSCNLENILLLPVSFLLLTIMLFACIVKHSLDVKILSAIIAFYFSLQKSGWTLMMCLSHILECREMILLRVGKAYEKC